MASDTPSAVRGFGDQDQSTPGERRPPGGDDAGNSPDTAQLLVAVQYADVREYPNPDSVASDYPSSN